MLKEIVKRDYARSGFLTYKSIFDRLDKNDQKTFREAARTKLYSSGQVVFSQGQECLGIYLVESGLIGLRRFDESGTSALLRLTQSGEALGYRSLINGTSHKNTAEVLVESKLYFINKSAFQWLAQRNHWLRECLLAIVLRDLDQSETTCAGLLTSKLRSRFLRLMATFSESHGELDETAAFRIELPIQRKDLADLLGTSPAALSRIIAGLQREGGIRFMGRQVFVSDPYLLTSEATSCLGPA